MAQQNDQTNFGFEDLKVWQKAVDFADRIIDMVDSIQTDRRHYRLIENLEASCTSVSCNIAEGKGRFSKKNLFNFFMWRAAHCMKLFRNCFYFIEKSGLAISN